MRHNDVVRIAELEAENESLREQLRLAAAHESAAEAKLAEIEGSLEEWMADFASLQGDNESLREQLERCRAAGSQMVGEKAKERARAEAAEAALETWTCEHTAELERADAAEARLAECREAGDLRMKKLAELETARHNTNLYWAKRERELQAELAEAQAEADAVIDSWRTQCIDQGAKLAEVEKELKRSEIELTHWAERATEVEKERDRLREENRRLGRNGDKLYQRVDRARERLMDLQESIASKAQWEPSRARGVWLAQQSNEAGEIARILSGDDTPVNRSGDREGAGSSEVQPRKSSGRLLSGDEKNG